MAKGVYYSGDVQGVGFRATAVSIARRHPSVRGWVRNLADGRVELFADGPAAAVDDFLADLREYMADYIRNENVFDREGDESVSGFRVTY
jgi:acylphosphatase